MRQDREIKNITVIHWRQRGCAEYIPILRWSCPYGHLRYFCDSGKWCITGWGCSTGHRENERRPQI